MNKQSEDIFHQALQLPVQTRAELVATLIDSMDDAESSAVELAWREEIDRRVDELDKGEVQTIPWEEVRKDIFGE